jgi:hypothetical protein
MLSCIAGALLCNASAHMTIPGPLAYAQPAQTGWSYTVLQQPVLVQQRVIVVRRA